MTDDELRTGPPRVARGEGGGARRGHPAAARLRQGPAAAAQASWGGGPRSGRGDRGDARRRGPARREPPARLGGAAARLASCRVAGSTADDAEAIFQMDHVRDYPLHLPAAYPLIGLRGRPRGTRAGHRRSGTRGRRSRGEQPGAGNHDLCMVVGTGEQPWQRVDIVDVDTTGLIGVLPEPTVRRSRTPWPRGPSVAAAPTRASSTSTRSTTAPTSPRASRSTRRRPSSTPTSREPSSCTPTATRSRPSARHHPTARRSPRATRSPPTTTTCAS